MQVGQGGIATLTAEFRIGGNLVVVTNPQIEILDATGDSVVTDVPTEVEPGSYTYDYAIDANAELGWWTARWTATGPNAETLVGVEEFEVVEEGQVVFTNNLGVLRSRLGDRFPPGSDDDSATFFTNDELHTLLAKHDDDLDRASYEGWLIKAAIYADLVDVNESGSSRSLSQKARQAQAMLDRYEKILSDLDELILTATGRAVGRAINLWPEMQTHTISEFAPDAVYVRTYALKRFPAVLA